MMVIYGALKVDPIIQHIDKIIDANMGKASYEIAASVERDAKVLLSERIAARGGHESGNLSRAIKAMKAIDGVNGLARADVVIDINAAPHAFWVESGARAGAGLPYSKAGGKDYSKSRFKGHHFIRDTLKEYKNEGKAVSIVAKHILNIKTGLTSPSSLASLSRM